MSVVVIEAPAAPAVSYEEAKKHLRLDHDDDEVYVTGLIAAAEGHLSAPFGWLGRSIGLQTLVLRTNDFRWCALQLPYGPVRSIVSVKYDDEAGDEQTVDTSVYSLSGVDSSMAFLRLVNGQSWPTPMSGYDVVRIAYTAGYEAADVPAPLKHAILLLVSHWYETREAVSGPQMYEVPMTVQALVSPFRLGAV